jgi:hypothetical protein
MAFSRCAFLLEAWLLRLMLRQVYVAWRNLSRESLAKLFHDPIVRRNLAFGIALLFPSAQKFTSAEWNCLLDDLEALFAPRLLALQEALPDYSLLDHGLVKLLKIALGVVVSCAAAAESSAESGDSRAILDTLRLAFSWGVTYPMVDNLLDSASASASLKTELVTTLETTFGDREEVTSAPLASAQVREVVARLKEVIELAPAQRRPVIRKTLLLLLEAHRRDSDRKLSAVGGVVPSGYEDSVWADSLLKSALIRIATMEICGTPVEGDRLAAQLAASLVNQLGDDLWDVEADVANDRVTPFTLQALGRSQRDAFAFYLRYCLRITRRESTARQVAIVFGVLDSSRCFFDAGAQSQRRFPHFARELASKLKATGLGQPSFSHRDVPHIDPDGVIFAFEEAAIDS